MQRSLEQPFEDLNGKFKARLKSSEVKQRSFVAREGSVTLTSVVGVFEASFDMDVLSHLEKPCFIAARRQDREGEKYLLYEVTGVKPVHYQMLSISSGMPRVVRHEYLEKVDQSWREEDTWIDIYSVYTGYVMRRGDGGYLFERNETIVPLEGAEARLLSVSAVESFVNVDGGVDVGVMEGFQRKLLVDLERLVKYHGGAFGFTGVGKSNLTSVIVRKVLENLPDVNVAVVDVAGEYGVGLADQIIKRGAIYTTEDYELAADKVEAFLASQAVPESLYEELNSSGRGEALERYAEKLFESAKVRKLDLEARSFDFMLRRLEGVGRPEAESLVMDLKAALRSAQLPTELNVSALAERQDAYQALLEVLESYKQGLEAKRYPPERLLAEVDLMLKILKSLPCGAGRRRGSTPEELAERLATGADGHERLINVYVPDPSNARLFVTRLIDALFSIRKRKAKGPRVLVVLDEAQEFIPDRALREDLTADSNVAVEKLLRQGRKYRLHGWVSTQRVAHLNVNAIQQVQSFFVGTLPREYDRRVIAEATGISPEILDKTAYLDVGEWLFVSFRATKLRNVPIFIRAENNEDQLRQELMMVAG